jgi:hypothetical protein
MPHQHLLSEALLGYFNVLINKGDIFVDGDFPEAGKTRNGWFYAIQDTVTDPVTGRTFHAGDYIVWNGTDWYLINSGGTSPGLRIVGPVTILSGNVEIVDIVPLSVGAIWYVLHISEPAADRAMTMQIQATHTAGAPGTFNHVVPAEVGDRMRVSSDTVATGTGLRLRLINNQPNPVTVIGKAIDV